MPGARTMAVATLALVMLGASAAQGDMEIKVSGVTLVLPRDAKCPAIVLPFAAAARYATDHVVGLHDGIDISLPEGTPLLALAAGKVINVGEGATSTGHYMWMQHAPDDTGLPFWLYSTYRHIHRVVELEVGAAVKVGQVIGAAGKPSYPNLHLATLVSVSPQYEARRTSVAVPGARLVDPAVVFVKGLRGLDDLERLPRAQPSVLVSYVTDDGVLRPAKSRVIWPVACQRN